MNGEEVPRLQGKLFGRLKAGAEAAFNDVLQGIEEWIWELDGEGGWIL